jgi:hypothetical protein
MRIRDHSLSEWHKYVAPLDLDFRKSLFQISNAPLRVQLPSCADDSFACFLNHGGHRGIGLRQLLQARNQLWLVSGHPRFQRHLQYRRVL